MQIKKRMRDFGDEYSELMLTFRDDYLSTAYESDNNVGCVWLNDRGEVARVQFDSLRTDSDAKLMRFNGSKISVTVINGDVTAELIEDSSNVFALYLPEKLFKKIHDEAFDRKLSIEEYLSDLIE